MNSSAPGANSGGSSGWDNPSWSSSLSDSSLSRPDEQPPNPFSREASSAARAPRARSRLRSGAAPDPYQRSATADPYSPTGYGGPLPASGPTATEPSPPGFDPHRPVPRARRAGPAYGSPPPAYARTTPTYAEGDSSAPSTAATRTRSTAYQPGYGMSSPYGVVPACIPRRRWRWSSASSASSRPELRNRWSAGDRRHRAGPKGAERDRRATRHLHRSWDGPRPPSSPELSASCWEA